MGSQPTLPIPVRLQDYKEARRLHMASYGLDLHDILRGLATAHNSTVLAPKLNRLSGRGALKSVSAQTLAQAVCSADGRLFWDDLDSSHNVNGLTANLLTGTISYLESVRNKILARIANAQNRQDIDLCLKLGHEVFNYDQFVAGNRIRVNGNGEYYWGRPIRKDAKGNQIPKDVLNWCAGEYILLSGVKYCTYCNADTVFAVRVTGGRMRPYASALDHFYSRSEHPYLALALENLIPTCTRCNSLFKGAKGKAVVANPVSPYKEDYYGLFTLEIGVGKGKPIEGFVADPKDTSWHVKLAEATSIEQSRGREMANNLFHLDDVYNQVFREDVSRTVHLVRNLTPPACQALSKLFPKIFAHRDARHLMLGCTLNHNEIPTSRFSKLTEDMMRQFGG